MDYASQLRRHKDFNRYFLTGDLTFQVKKGMPMSALKGQMATLMKYFPVRLYGEDIVLFRAGGLEVYNLKRLTAQLPFCVYTEYIPGTEFTLYNASQFGSLLGTAAQKMPIMGDNYEHFKQPAIDLIS